MSKQVKQYIILIVAGVLIGLAMQLFPHFPGEFGQNFITYMSTDWGSWAVIAIIIASFSKTALESALKCFAFMAAMVAAYYAVFPVSIHWNMHWVILAVLMLPIGFLIYWYKSKLWVFLLLEAAMAGFLVMDIFAFISKITLNQLTVYDETGTVILLNETPFTLVNYILLILFVIFGMIFLIWQYQKNKGIGQKIR